MTRKHGRTAKVEKAKAVVYWRRAQHHLLSAKEAAEKGRLDTAALLGIRAAMAANDALCVKALGERSASPNHFDAADLLKLVRIAEAAEKSRQLRQIILEKNRAEYEDRPMTQSDAERLLVQVERFVQWVERIFSKFEQG